MEATIMAMTRTYTAEEVFELNLDEPFELIDGELHILPGSAGRASAIGLRVGRFIGNYLDDHPIGDVSGADGAFVLSRNPDVVLAPDAGFVRYDHLVGGVIPNTFIPTYPDLAVEVRSPSNRLIDDERKIQRYFTAGTSIVWLIDPKSETVTVYRRSGRVRQLSRGQILSGEDVLPGFEVLVDKIFNQPGQK
jgi:Uma2 family endonuclease